MRLGGSLVWTLVVTGLLVQGISSCAPDSEAPAESEGLGGAGAAGCQSDRDCNGIYCDGRFACEPDDGEADEHGCVYLEPTCAEDQSCNERRRTCDEACANADQDGDGHDSRECGGDDCDDENGLRYPGAEEVCDVDSVDEDCDPTTFGVRDADDDGYADAQCCNEDEDGLLTCGEDCNDTRRNVHPDAPDTCNGFDEDCDGEIDEDGELVTLYPDCDGDGFGEIDSDPQTGCAPSEPPDECSGASAGWSTVATDCDDTRASVGPGFAEVCDGLDNDCDPETWEASEDDDGDGFPDADCGGTDCDDECPTCFPGGGPELCDALDHNCDGDPEDGVPEEDYIPFFEDSDGDGVGKADVSVLACFAATGYAETAGDCNDAEGATGICEAPTRCLDTAICGCWTQLYNNAEYLDLDAGTTSVPAPSGGSDVIVNNGTLGRMHLSARTGVTWRRLEGRTFASVTLADASTVTSTGEDPLEWVPGPDGTVYIVKTPGGLYKLGYFENPGQVLGVGFSYAPLGPVVDGFACHM